ncbi:MAG TPA: serine hydrolase [Verrucomicrobiales bacterium]|nr:serine hydrolase [Verrucomicrobiales bacterium]
MTFGLGRWTMGAAAVGTLAWGTVAADERWDLVLEGGRIVDGTGAPWHVADVAVSKGRIQKIGNLAGDEAKERLDIAGMVVAPGFIDMMGQTATPFLSEPGSALNLLTQGITTINAGEGQSAAPLSEEAGRRRGWTTMAEYFQLLESAGLPINVAQTIGHTQVRELVLGDGDRKPNAEELERMRIHVREAMEAGATGVSTALIYPPAVYAGRDEIAALAAVAGEYGGRYYTHMRNEGDQLLEAIEEALAIGGQAGAPVHIFHLKAAGKANWAKMEQALARINAARAAGQEVTADVYPYVNNGLGIRALIHPRHYSEGSAAFLGRLDDPALRATIRMEMEEDRSWENWFLHTGGDWGKLVLGTIEDSRYAEHSGTALAAIAEARGEDPWDAFFELVRLDAPCMPETMTESNKIQLMREDLVSFCTDFGPAGDGRTASHPRGYGAFPRIFARYVRDLGALSLERAVAKAAAAGANGVMAFDRGRIAEGLAADIVVFDAEKISDRSTFGKPAELSVGVEHVVVNGELVLRGGKQTERLPGRVLRGPGHRDERVSWAVSTGELDPRMRSFDETVQGFLEEHRIPGAALAVVDEGRLVYARGYGYADVGKRELVRPESLFRIASISKPLTAAAALRLVEGGKLSLEDRAADHLTLDAGLSDAAAFDPRLREVTIRQLLQHRAGWDRDVSFDPMFQSRRFAEAQGVDSPADIPAVIRAMAGQTLDFEPGERYAYSNYGYCLLGRIIEKVAGKGYEEAVRELVLAPLGMKETRLGKTLREAAAPGEVRYYDPGRGKSVYAADDGELAPNAYGTWHLEAMDAHGGWLSSALDLARFAAAMSDPEGCPILSKESMAEMFSRPEGHQEEGRYYSLGWFNRDTAGGSNHWHTGSLPGTATLLVLRPDGKAWVILFNARVSSTSKHVASGIDPLLHRAADAVVSWPAQNLFE